MQSTAGTRALLALVATGLAATAAAQEIHFTDVTVAAGVYYEHGYQSEVDELRIIASGMAAGDYDGDGWLDLYAEHGDVAPNLLFRNLGDGTFEEVGAVAGVAVDAHVGAGPTFGDLDGDGWLDLVLGGVDESRPIVFRNLGNGSFEEVTAQTGLTADRNTFSIAFGDYDRDGAVDLLMSHWTNPLTTGCEAPCTGHLWRNEGAGTFYDADLEAGLLWDGTDQTFTPNLADIDDDGWPDLLMASDYGTSRVFRNLGDGTFAEVTDREVITDDNGMGAAVGDYDNDGDLDWFVTSIKNEQTGTQTGNRLYRNLGDGIFEDATDAAGVRVGGWAWGACFADVDNDGWLDLFHTNGFNLPDFEHDRTKLFHANGDGTFSERGEELGIVDDGQGRGVVCFDYDRDGDLDLMVINSRQAPVLYRNDGGNAMHWLEIRLRGRTRNVHGLGARIRVEAAGGRQIREIRQGSNFVSQQPAEAHFGLGAESGPVEVEVIWPDGIVNTWSGVAPDQMIELRQIYDSTGLYGAGSFALRNVNLAGPADLRLSFGDGADGLTAIAGDWDGDGRDEVGLYDGSQGTFYLRLASGGHLRVAFGPGGSGTLPVMGDWDGDGIDTLGVFSPLTHEFLLRNANTPGDADLAFELDPNRSGGIAVAGDWNGDGVDTVGLFQRDRFALRNSNSAGAPDLLFSLAGADRGALPLVGDWDGDRVDGVGLYEPRTGRMLLRNELSTGAAEIEFPFGPHGSELRPVAGRWN